MKEIKYGICSFEDHEEACRKYFSIDCPELISIDKPYHHNGDKVQRMGKLYVAIKKRPAGHKHRIAARTEAYRLKELYNLGVHVPEIHYMIENQEEETIVMQYLQGLPLTLHVLNQTVSENMLIDLGHTVGTMHANGWIHGDLAAHHVLVNTGVYLIDLEKTKKPTRPRYAFQKEIYRFIRGKQGRRFPAPLQYEHAEIFIDSLIDIVNERTYKMDLEDVLLNFKKETF